MNSALVKCLSLVGGDQPPTGCNQEKCDGLYFVTKDKISSEKWNLFYISR